MHWALLNHEQWRGDWDKIGGGDVQRHDDEVGVRIMMERGEKESASQVAFVEGNAQKIF